MNSSSGRKRSHRLAYGEVPTEKQSTLSEEHVKKLLEKQTCKNTCVEKELKRPKNFVDGVVVKDGTSKKAGMKSLDEFKTLTAYEEKETSLRGHGLTEEEVALMLKTDKQEKSNDESYRFRMKIIEKKISQHKEQLQQEDKYKSCVSVNRRELETELATHHGLEKPLFSHLIQHKAKEYPTNDPVIATLREYNEVFKTSKDEEQEEEEEIEDGDLFIGPLLSSINERVECIPDELIFRNRISLTDIHKMEKFKNYKAGIPSKVLYIKNLAREVKEGDLARLFSRYYVKDESDVEYKIMSGRMHGQAFVTFHDEDTAVQALLLCNGYKLYDKPIIISYGKTKS